MAKLIPTTFEDIKKYKADSVARKEAIKRYHAWLNEQRKEDKREMHNLQCREYRIKQKIKRGEMIDERN